MPSTSHPRPVKNIFDYYRRKRRSGVTKVLSSRKMSLAFIHNLAYGLEDGLGTVNDATRAAEQYTKHEEHTLSKPTDDSLDGGQHHVRKTGAMSLPVELLEQILGYVLTDNESLTIRLRKA